MKRVLSYVACLCLAVLSALAQDTKMRDVFAQMPDSIFPLITKNNRLDCIDFRESNMPAMVKNLMDEPIELTVLTEDYLKLTMSKVSTAEMKLLPATEGRYVICLVRTYEGPIKDSSIRFYDDGWNLLSDLSVPVPDMKEFLPLPEAADLAIHADALAQMRDLPFVEMSLNPSQPTLQLNFQPGELLRKEREYATRHLKTLTYEWDGLQFKRLVP